MVKMTFETLVQREAPARHALDQRDTAARRFAFVAAELIGGAVRQAHAAHHAAVGGFKQ
jgi:hypothetical protein